MPKIDGVFIPAKPSVAQKPREEAKPPFKPAIETDEAADSRKGESSFSAGLLKFKLQAKPLNAGTAPSGIKAYGSADAYERAALNKSGQIPPTPVPTSLSSEEIRNAEAAAKAVEEAYAHSQTQCARGSSGDPARDAAAKLEEVTRNVSPEMAAAIIERSQATIDKITADLGARAKSDDGSYGDDKASDQIFTDLAKATNRAALAPNGKEVVSQVASSVVKNIDAEGIGRWDEAIGKAIGKGAGADLSIEIINQLSAAGRTGQADDILQNVKDGVNELKDSISKATEKTEELNWLIAQWAPMMSEDQLNGAIEAYKKENPEAAKALEDLNRLGGAAVATLASLSSLPPDVAKLGNADDVRGALEKFAGDEKVIAAISQSMDATKAIGQLMEDNPAAFDNIVGLVGKLDDGIGFVEQAKNGKKLVDTLFKKAMDFSIDGVAQSIEAGNTASAKAFLNSLKFTADRLGFSHHKMDDAFKNLEKAIDAKTPRQLEGALYGLGRNIDDLEDLKILTPESGLGTRMRGAGLVIGAVATGASLKQAYDDPSFQNTLGALADSVGLASGVAEVLGKGGLLKTAGKFAGGVSSALDIIGVAQDVSKGDYVNAGFGLSSAVGGALLAFGTTAAATGIGAILVGGALLGSYLYNKSQAANRFESDGARAFLEGAGINKDLANQLINNDDNGRSPARVLTALAEKLNVDPKEFFEYLSKLSPEDAKRLMETAHGVDPNDEGIFPDEKENRRYTGRGGSYVDPAPNDLTDLANWMRENGYEDAPGI